MFEAAKLNRKRARRGLLLSHTLLRCMGEIGTSDLFLDSMYT